MNTRIEAMRALTDAMNAGGLRRTTLNAHIAESLKTTVGEAREIRRAKAFAHHLEKCAQPVYAEELLTGSVTGMWEIDENPPTYDEYRAEAERALSALDRANPNPDTVTQGFFDERVFAGKSRFAIMARDHYDARIPYQTLQKLIREMSEKYTFLTYSEIGKALENLFVYDYGSETRDIMRELPWDVANHTHLNYKKVLKLGFAGIRGEISEKRSENPTFYDSLLISVDAAIAFIKRYAESARRAGYIENAERIARVSENPPENFKDAMQLTWLTHLIANLGGGSALSFARFDQYMFGFFRKDVAAGVIDDETALEWVCALWLKMNEPKMRTVQSVCLGGVTRSGENAANALTRVCIRATKLLKLPYPNVSVRYFDGVNPDWLLSDAVDCVRAGGGMPMILNDKAWIENMARSGLDVEDARDYYNMGCVEMMIEGCMPNWVGAPGIGFARAVNEALNDMHTRGDYAPTFEELQNRVTERMRAKIEGARVAAFSEIMRQSDFCRDPFASALVEGCVESGKDYFAGGTRLGAQIAVGALGLGTAADSLESIRELVFEKKQYTLPQICAALESNFEGCELMRAKLSRCKAYGNDDEQPDSIAKTLFDAYVKNVSALNRAGERVRFVTNLFSYHSHISEGERLGATANGRLAGESVSDCVGATQGRDVLGPTCMLNSVLKLDLSGVTGAYALNMKLTSSAAGGDKGQKSIESLVRSYFRRKGPQVQINFANAADMEDAKIHPEKHANLVVRIAGYCEYFVNLDSKLQDEIIRRTAFEVA